MATHTIETMNIKARAVTLNHEMFGLASLERRPTCEEIDAVGYIVIAELEQKIKEIRSAKKDKIIAISVVGNVVISDKLLKSSAYFIEQYMSIGNYYIFSEKEEYEGKDIITVREDVSFEWIKSPSRGDSIIMLSSPTIKDASLFSKLSSVEDCDVEEYRFILPSEFDENIDFIGAIFNKIDNKSEFFRYIRGYVVNMDIIDGHR